MGFLLRERGKLCRHAGYDDILLGCKVEAMSDDERAKAARRTDVFAPRSRLRRNRPAASRISVDVGE
jgi:hypothetical protein